MSKTCSLREAADFLGVSYRTIRRYVKKGLPYVEVRGDRGVEYRIRQKDLEKMRLAEGDGESAARAVDDKGGEPVSLTTADTALQERGPAQPRVLEETAPRGLMQQLLELYEAEIDFLRQQIRVKDEQLATKERQLFSFQETFSRLTHQNEVLTMIAQGVEPQKLLRDKRQEGRLVRDASEQKARPTEALLPAAEPLVVRDEIVSEVKKMFKGGRSKWEIKEFIKKHGYDSVGLLLAK